MKETVRLDKEIMIAFVDIEKAFYNTSWNIMFKILRDVKIDYRDTRIIRRM